MLLVPTGIINSDGSFLHKVPDYRAMLATIFIGINSFNFVNLDKRKYYVDKRQNKKNYRHIA
jgi:hypothetical protein